MEPNLPGSTSDGHDTAKAEGELPGVGSHDRFLIRLWDLVVKPDRLMRKVAERPRWWHPGLLIFVSVVILTWLTYPIAVVDSRQQLEQKRDSWPYSEMTDVKWNELLEKVEDTSFETRLRGSLGAGFMMWILVIVVGLVLGFFVKMANGKGTAWQAVSVASWSYVPPLVFASIVKVPLVFYTESASEVNIGIAALVDVDQSGALWKIINLYGDFSIWWCLALLVVGFGRVFRIARRTAAVTVLLPWFLLSLIVLGYQLFFM